MKIHPEEARIV